MRRKRSQYQQGSIRKVRKAKGYAWEVRFPEWLSGKRFQRTMTFQGTEYPKEAEVRKAIELTVSQINSGTAGEKADAKFGAIITLYRRKFLPSESRLFELKKKLHKVFSADRALVDAFTSREKSGPCGRIASEHPLNLFHRGSAIEEPRPAGSWMMAAWASR